VVKQTKELKSHITGVVLFTAETLSMLDLVQQAVRRGAALRESDLRGANVENTKWPAPSIVLLVD
jgi:hypothetical protein